MSMKVVFLHIPKTAGQSVRAALEAAFGKRNVCPAQVNWQLMSYSISELDRYKAFSGHLDWSLLDCLTGPVYRFTVLRNPIDRILSFYFYLRGKAEGMSKGELSKPQNRGLRAAKNLSPDEYFAGGGEGLRKFLDGHYDNFYTYFFAARRFSGRGDLRGLLRRKELSEKRVVEMALDNMSRLDDVFTLDRMDWVFSKLAELSDRKGKVKKDYRINVNVEVQAQERLDRLRELGATQVTMDRLEAFCRMDNQIWRHFSGD